MLVATTLLALAFSVTMRYTNPGAKSVAFTGDIFGWSQTKPMTRTGGDWTIDLAVPDDARFEYKFVVDGRWILDPKNPKKVDNGVGGENSVYEGSEYRLVTFEQEPKHPMKRSTLLVGGREIVVYAPGQSQGLPILVYGDGPNYERYGKIQNVVANLAEVGRIRLAVLALVPPIDRAQEYGLKWRAYGRYLLDEVVPAVRKETGASEKAEDLYVGGSSMGGIISLRLAEEFPDRVAGGVHSQSGAFVEAAPGMSFVDVVSPESLGKLNPKTKLWLCWGAYEADITRMNEVAVANLKKMNRPFGSKVTNEGHNWTAWRGRMAEALEYLLHK